MRKSNRKREWKQRGSMNHSQMKSRIRNNGTTAIAAAIVIAAIKEESTRWIIWDHARIERRSYSGGGRAMLTQFGRC